MIRARSAQHETATLKKNFYYSYVHTTTRSRVVNNERIREILDADTSEPFTANVDLDAGAAP